MTTAWSVRIDWLGDQSDDALMDIAEAVHPHHGVVGSNTVTGLISIQISIDAPTLRQASDAALAIARDAAHAAGQRFAPARLEVIPEDVFRVEQNHPTIPQLVGYAEIAIMAGVSRQRAREFADLPGFPPAVAKPSTGPFRIRDQVSTWLSTRSRTPGRRPQSLSGLIEAGLLSIGDTLQLHQGRANSTGVATIEPDGSLSVEGKGTFPSPSAAAGAVTGGKVNGWSLWRRESDGKTLDDLRAQLG